MVTIAVPARAVTWQLRVWPSPLPGLYARLTRRPGRSSFGVPAQPSGTHHFARTSDYVIEILFAASVLGTASAATLPGRYLRTAEPAPGIPDLQACPRPAAARALSEEQAT